MECSLIESVNAGTTVEERRFERCVQRIPKCGLQPRWLPQFGVAKES